MGASEPTPKPPPPGLEQAHTAALPPQGSPHSLSKEFLCSDFFSPMARAATPCKLGAVPFQTLNFCSFQRQGVEAVISEVQKLEQRMSDQNG